MKGAKMQSIHKSSQKKRPLSNMKMTKNNK